MDGKFKRELPYRLLDTSKYPPEVAGRFNSFINTQFNDSLSVEMQMRSIIKWATDNFKLMDSEYKDFTEYIINKNINPFIEFLNDLIEYMNEFVDTFDTKFQEEILKNLQQWNDDGTLETLINEILDTKYHEMDSRLTEQLAQTVKDSTKGIMQAKKINNTLSSIRDYEPLVTFIDDDGNRAILSKLLPLSQEYGIPFTVCMPSDFMLGESGLTAKELKTLQDEHGFEIASHGKTHTPINDDMSEEQQYEEVYGSWKVMSEHGLNIESIVYPYGQHTAYSRRIASMYYKAGFSTAARLETSPIQTYRLGRTGFPSSGKDLAYFKSKVDEAIANNGWLIFMLHCGQAEHNAAAQIMLEELIQYIQSKNVEIVNASEGIDLRGNVFEMDEQELYIGADGTNNIRDLIYSGNDIQTGVAKYNGNSMPRDFPLYKVSVSLCNSATDVATAPNKKKGRFTTYADGASGIVHQQYQSRREFYHRQSEDGDESWTPWFRYFVSKFIFRSNFKINLLYI